MKKFYMVKLKSDYGKEDYPSKKEHSNFRDAKIEAYRLARQSPEKEFYILETICMVQSDLNIRIQFIDKEENNMEN